MKPERITLKIPNIGGKCWLLDRSGLFVLEEGEGVLRTIACTHAGAGPIVAFDGVPNEKGFMPEIEPGSSEWGHRHGRLLYNAHPAVMGSWMLDAGFINGLTLFVPGGHQGQAPVASIVWMPRSVPAKKPVAA